jgi:hypothetical protein
MPYKAQHVILNTAQRILEECCYDFVRAWLPAVLTDSGWDCAEAVELTTWTRMLLEHSDSLPPQALAADGANLEDVFYSTNQLRHTAVHRLPTTASGIAKLVQSALTFAETLQDLKRAVLLEELHREIESNIKAMELHKNALEDGLSYELGKIRRKREKLNKMEKMLVENMIQDDLRNQGLVGSVLECSVCRIFDQEPEPQAIVDADQNDSEPSLGKDLNTSKERELLAMPTAAEGDGVSDKKKGASDEKPAAFFATPLKRASSREQGASDMPSDGLSEDDKHLCGQGVETEENAKRADLAEAHST